MKTKPFTYVPQTSGATVAAAVAGHQGGVVASVNNPSEGLALYQASPKKMRPLCAFTPESPKTGVYTGLATCKTQGIAIDDYYIMRAIMAIAAVAMFDSRAAFSPSIGTAPGDVGSRWYPFWAAAIMGVAALVVAYRALLTPQTSEGVFQGRESIFAVLKLVLPMLAYATLIGGIRWQSGEITYTVIPPLGFYVATA